MCRRWEETFHGRDFSVPRKFMPNIIRALFRKGKVRLCQEPAAKTEQRGEKAAMEMRLTEWRVHMDMDKPNEELRAIAQRLDSDRDAKVRTTLHCCQVDSIARHLRIHTRTN